MPALANQKLIGFVGTAAPARAREFYGGTLGLRMLEENPFALVYEVNGTMLRVTKVAQVVAAQYTVLGFAVADIVAAVSELSAAGVVFERYPGMPQDELGIWDSPAGARIAWFKDPDGNLLSVSQF